MFGRQVIHGHFKMPTMTAFSSGRHHDGRLCLSRYSADRKFRWPAIFGAQRRNRRSLTPTLGRAGKPPSSPLSHRRPCAGRRRAARQTSVFVQSPWRGVVQADAGHTNFWSRPINSGMSRRSMRMNLLLGPTCPHSGKTRSLPKSAEPFR